MSRIGKKPVPVGKAKVTINGQKVDVEGTKGKLSYTAPPQVKVELKDNQVLVTRTGDDRQSKAMHGLVRALINNMVVGATEGYKKVLEVRGVGYKAELRGKELVLSLGFANQLKVSVPQGLTVTVEPGQGDVANKITVAGADRQQVGDFAANIRKLRKPEPYKGKGIRYEGEAVRIKPGKAFAGAGSK
ncbi:MAG: 50S ribosomal protein L6 [Phycisphaerae bacterium]|jgi:large subunit ribosomal protein L6|nr:MAG: 50S ribosomal protein L6 [Phycisphaerae bacterium]